MKFRKRLASLEHDFAVRDNISVFYQISSQPLYTINKNQIISEAITFCGGSNIFADLDELAPVVSPEAVVSRDPAAMIAPQIADEDPLARWRSFVTMTAVRSDNLYTVNADLVARATPRLLDGVRQICEALDSARAKYPRKKK
jgi:iron complex transport system substrate-binding protein